MMLNEKIPFLAIMVLCLMGISSASSYKARPWDIRDRDSYPAGLTSEKVTIAVDPLFTDALAARVFDKNDIVTRGIMPLAIVIFNDNDFPVEVDGLSIQLIHEKDRVRTLTPNEVVYRIFKKEKSWLDKTIPKVPKSELNEDALDDFDQKFLLNKVIGPHDKGGGFVYLHIPGPENLVNYLSNSLIYIPNVYRRDNDSRLIFFEIDVGPSVESSR
jgi:hypothetical protein